MAVVYGGDRVTQVSAELADAFVPGDRLIVVQTSGDLLHVPGEVWSVARAAVGRAHTAFGAMGSVSDDAISAFFDGFADRLGSEETFAPIADANAADVAAADQQGRSTTRLVLSDKMRSDMIAGLRAWSAAESGRGAVARSVHHDGWRVELIRSGLGVVGFVFEGRPNVFADACGVLRTGNTVVFRIGSDALGTANAIVEHALDPALAAAGLPPGAASLVDSSSRAAGWAMFCDQRLALAVARGSGTAVAQLGAVARQAGVAVSLHGTGGAWIVAGATADAARLGAVVEHSLDRKVCNTLNTCAVMRSRADELVPVVLDAVRAAAERRGAEPKLHVTDEAVAYVPAWWWEQAGIGRAEGVVVEPRAERIDRDRLGEEWEWEHSPEVSLVVVDDLDEAVALFNRYSPQFIASLVSEDTAEHDLFFAGVNAPFVGDGFTRWVDGQYALDTPELGLSNWEGGRLFGRGGVLSGDSVFTLRARAHQHDPSLRR